MKNIRYATRMLTSVRFWEIVREQLMDSFRKYGYSAKRWADILHPYIEVLDNLEEVEMFSWDSDGTRASGQFLNNVLVDAPKDCFPGDEALQNKIRRELTRERVCALHDQWSDATCAEDEEEEEGGNNMKINNNTLSLFKELDRRDYVLSRSIMGTSEIYEAEKLVKAGIVSKGHFDDGTGSSRAVIYYIDVPTNKELFKQLKEMVS